jgi:hypothetical protein
MANVIMTRQLVKDAVEIVEFSIRQMMKAGITNGGDLHIVVLDPSKPYYVGANFMESIYYEHSIGDVPLWNAAYDSIARGKAAHRLTEPLRSAICSAFVPGW